MPPSPTSPSAASRSLAVWRPTLAWALLVFLLLSLPMSEGSLDSLSWLERWVDDQRDAFWQPLLLLALRGVDGIGDKIVHAVLFAVQGALVQRVLAPRRRRWQGILEAALWATLYGVATELWQAWGPMSRSGSFGDVVADATGALLGAMAAARFGARWRAAEEAASPVD